MFIIVPFKDVALAAATAETVLQLRAIGSALEVVEVVCNFDGIEGAAVPVLIELVRQRQDGTLGTQLVCEKLNPLDRETIAGQGWSGTTVEPSVLHVLHTWRRHPQGGLNYVVPEANKGKTLRLLVPHEERLGLRVTAAAIVNATGYIVFHE